MKHTLRGLLRAPGFSLTVILTLGVAIAGAAIIFSIVDAVLLRPLPYHNAERLVALKVTQVGEPGDQPHAPGDFLDLRRTSRSLTDIAGFRDVRMDIAVGAGVPIPVDGAYVTAAFFDTLGVPAAIGRTSTSAEAAAGRRVLLADGTWRRLFNGDPAAVGRTLRIDGQPHVIAGVMPPSFNWPEGTGAWVLSPDPVPPPPIDVVDLLAERRLRYFEAIARLRDGVSLEQAAADLDAAMRDIGRQHSISSGRRVTPLPLAESVIADARGGLLLLLGAVGCLLLLACTNIAGLFITRGLAQQREIAVRLALGGGRAGIVGRLVTEGLVLAVVGGALGFVFTTSLTAVVVRLMPDTVPRLAEVHTDGRVALFTAVIACAAGIICSLGPSLRLVASGPMALSDARSVGGAGRARATLIVAQLALTVVLLAGAGLLITSLVRLRAVDTGVTASQVVLADVPLPTGRYAAEDVRERFFDRLLESLAANGLPGAALIFPRPMADAVSGTEYEIEDQPIVAEGERPHTTISVVSPGTFSALGMVLVAGRGFEPRDRDPAPPVVVVNSAFARLHWPDEDAVGKRLTFDARQSSAAPTWQTVIGVVGDTRLRRLDIAPEPTVYLSYHQLAVASTIVVGGAADAGAVAGRVRDALRGLDRDLALGEVTTFSAAKDASAAAPRFRAAVIAAFGLVSLLVAAIGVYGLLSATVNQRRREFGVRAAVGATPADVLRLVLGHGAQLVAAGMLLGLAFAAAGRRLVEGLLFGVSASDVPTFAGALLLLGAAALAACALPALRAARIDPSTALRGE